MKHLTKTLLIITVLFISISCSKDEVNEVDQFNASDLVGSWKATDYHGTSTTETTMSSYSSTATDTFEASSFDNYTSVFTENPNETYNSGSITIHHNIVTNGVSSEQDTPVTANPNDISNWEFQNNILTFTPVPSNFDEVTTTITELSETTLKTRFNGKSTFNQYGITTESEIEIFMTFERQ